MLEFEAMKLLFSFLNVAMNCWNDFVGWAMVKCLHKQMIKNMKVFIAGPRYLAFYCDEVTTNEQLIMDFNSLL
jgi:hypothetical protein